jgi:hypothetical protein
MQSFLIFGEFCGQFPRYSSRSFFGLCCDQHGIKRSKDPLEPPPDHSRGQSLPPSTVIKQSLTLPYLLRTRKDLGG